MTDPNDKPKPPSVMAPQAVTLGRIYAEALLDSLPDPQKACAFGRELLELGGVLRETPGGVELLTNPSIRDSQRLAMVERIFGPHVSEPVFSLLGVLAKNHRLGLLPAIAEQFHALLDTRTGHIEVNVRSATPLTEEQTETLTRTLTEKLGATPKLAITVDPGLVGGLCVQVGDTIYDASVASALQRFREKMKSENER